MKERAIVLSVFMAGGVLAPCQQTFITQFDLMQQGYGGVGRAVFERPEGYVIFTDNRSNDGLLLGRVGRIRLDTMGSLVEHYNFDDHQPYNCSSGYFSTMSRLGSGGYVAYVAHFGIESDHSLWLYRFDENGDSIEAKSVLVYPPEDSVLLGGRQVRTVSDGGYIMSGWYYENTILGQGLLLKIDSLGTLEWTARYGSAIHQTEILGVAEYLEHGFLAIGQRAMSYVNNDCFLIRTDSLGNQLWRREFGGNADVTGMVRVTADGNCVTWSEYREVGWPLLYQQLMLTKWDAAGDIIWQKRSHYQSDAACGDLEVLPDGSFITVGRQGGWAALMKFSSAGDSLWTRYLHMFTDGSAHNAYDVESTSDGGFIATGDAFQGWADPTPNLQTIWVIKTDSLGCVVPGCQNVGVQEMVLDLQDRLHISPNPTSEYVSLALDLPEGGQVQGQVQAHLLDAQGKLVLQQPVQQNLNKLSTTLVVRALPAGTYYLHLRDAKRWLAGGKVVVQ